MESLIYQFAYGTDLMTPNRQGGHKEKKDKKIIFEMFISVCAKVKEYFSRNTPIQP